MSDQTFTRRGALRVAAGAAAATIPTVSFLRHANAAEHTLKIASLAPPGSLWLKAVEAAARDVKEKTGGKVEFKIYGGGVMGDERAMVRKMRTGQLDAAVVTSIGLGDIDKQLLVLQLPLIFKSYDELDRVRTKMSGTFGGILGSKGFKILGWGDVGFNYLFTNAPVALPSDAKATKMWIWDSDPISKEVAKVAGINPTYLGVPDVLPSLSTGVIDAFMNSPYGAMALQWHTKAKFVTDLKLAVVIGGTVIKQDTWAKLPADIQGVVADAFATHHKGLLATVRQANDQAKKELVGKHGYKAVSVSDFGAWKTLSDQVRANLTGSLFPKPLVDEMLGHL